MSTTLHARLSFNEWNYFLSFNFLSDHPSDKKLSDKK